MRDELSLLRITCLSLCASLYCFVVLWLTDQFLFGVIDGYFLGASYVAPCCTVFFLRHIYLLGSSQEPETLDQ